MHVSMKPLLPPRTTLGDLRPTTASRSRPGPEIRPLGEDPGQGGSRSGRHAPRQGGDADAGGVPDADPHAGFAAWLAKHDLDSLG